LVLATLEIEMDGSRALDSTQAREPLQLGLPISEMGVISPVTFDQ
jgi:hypothetical protein